MLLDVKQSKSGKALVLTDPNGEVHACTSAEELWATMDELLKDPEQPDMETGPTPGPTPRARRRSAPQDDGGGALFEHQEGDGEDIVDELLGRGLQSLIGGIRRASFRGKTRGGRRPTVRQEEPEDDG